MSFLFHLKALLGSKVAALTGAAVLLGAGAAIASPATPVLEIVPASDSDEVTDDGSEAHDAIDDATDHEARTDELTETSTHEPAAVEEAELKKTDAPGQLEASVEVTPDANDDEGRSEVAEAVHNALSGGLSPGDEGFGQAVAKNARSNRGNGAAASAAAREANGSAGRGPGKQDTEAEGAPGATDGHGAPQGRGPDGAGPPGHAKGR